LPLILAGLQKNSFIDYPGKISCVLFLTGCNFICPYCHNAELARGEYPARIDMADALGFLESRRGMLDGVVVTGGEPTLARGIVELCRRIKALGYPLKIDTNGSRPRVLGELLDRQLVDFVAMDIKAPLNRYAPFCRQADIADSLAPSIRRIMESAPAYEFRTTCAAPFVDQGAIVSIATAIEGAASYVLQSFNRRAVCLDPAFGRDTDPTIPIDSMRRLQHAAAPYVRRCSIR
jgi:pyruvate formate lyase activating enzyme